MTSALIRKSWTDLSRRPARTVLTILTLALAVASFGILALPSLMDRAMTGEVARANLYDLYVPIDRQDLSPTQLRDLGQLPNVKAVVGRTLFATKTLIGTRRVDTEIWGVADFATQPVDRVITNSRPEAGQLLVDVRDSMSGISSTRAGDNLSVKAFDGTFRSMPVTGSARAMAFNGTALTGHLVLYADQATVENLSGSSGDNLLEFRLIDTSNAAAQKTITSIRSFLDAQPQPGSFQVPPTIRAQGDWPLKSVFDSRAKVLDILILLAVLSAVFLLANTIRTLVAEQSREIGIMRSIGASARDVRNSYLRTAALLGLFGAILGAALGIGLAYLLVKLFARLVFGIAASFAIDLLTVGIGAVAGIVGAVLTALPTLRRVLRMPVFEALASDGPATAFGSSPLDHALVRLGSLLPSVRIGLRNVARQKGRTFTTVVQVALAVGTLLGLLSFGLAVSQVTDQSWNVLDYDITASAQPGGHLYDAATLGTVRAQAGVAAVEQADWTQTSYRGQTLVTLGTHADTFIREGLATGRWLTAADESTNAHVAVIGSAAARRWHLRPGAHITVTTSSRPIVFGIVGVGSSQANNGYNLYVPLTALQAITGRAGVANSLLIRTLSKNHDAVDAVAAHLEDVLARSGRPSQIQITYAGRATDKATSRGMLVIVQAIGLLTVAISMLGLVNAITMSIIERTREIGVLRSLGARARDLRRIFRTETTTIALTGYLLAIPTGWLVAKALQWHVLRLVDGRLPAPYTLMNLVYALIGTIVLALLVVIAPLHRATHLHPGDAIRYS